MPKDKRVYITVHNGMPEHPKVETLTDAAFRALVSLWCWCSRTESDGKVPDGVWVKRASLKVRRELIRAGMAEVIPDGVYMHDYLEHQRSAAEIEDLREKRAKAGSVGGKSKASAMALATANEQQSASKTLPETETESSMGFSRWSA